MSDRINFGNFVQQYEECVISSPMDAHQRQMLKDFLALLENRVSHEFFMAGCSQEKAVKDAFSRVAVKLQVEDRLRYR